MLILMHKGANQSVTDEMGCNLVHWAAYRNDVLSLRILKAYGFSLETQSGKEGMTPLHFAVKGESVMAIEYLVLNAPATLDVKNSDNQTPEAYARFKQLWTSW
jgi:ankyrin repeat protein